MLERDLESRLREQVKKVGGYLAKLDARAHKGVPDRIVTIGGVSCFVELKTITGRLSPLQVHEIEKIQKAGGKVAVLYGPDAIDTFVGGMCLG